MAEIGISIASKIAEYLVDPILHRARYLFCFNQFIGDVGIAKVELESTLMGVKKRAEEATKRTEEITQPVKKWMNDVENILQEVQKLQEKAEEGRLNCFHVSLRYYVAKEMANKVEQMMKLNNNNKFEPFSFLMQLPGIDYFASKDFVYFSSTKSTYDKLFKAIKDNKSTMVGLYGIGGSGKTTLANELGKKVKELKLFDKVVMAVVSKPLNVGNIQDQIADQIEMKFDTEKTQSGRAQRLLARLQNERIFIILDDVWGKLNLHDIGIPSNDNKGCCVVLTTRIRGVCISMDCQSIIELPLLTEKEAWALFMLHANITNDSSIELRDVAWNIVYECKGLPIAIVTVGSTLKGRSFVEWELALSRLRHSRPFDVEEGLRNPYACLELSYENLRSDITKSLFLLCSMFPEDYNISKEDLVRYGKGVLKLGETVNTMEEVRIEIYVAVNILIDSCLLMPTNEQACIKMHDLVRDVALWIAAKEVQAIMVASQGDPRMLMENEAVKDTKIISLWDLEKNFTLSNQFHYPTLEILLLHAKGTFKEANIYFEGMKELKVLAFNSKWSEYLYASKTWSMPQSIKSLTNLRILRLRGNSLGDISFLDNLEGLEILDLRRSSFNELPIGIINMKKLKLLDLWRCLFKKSPYQIIRKCSQLEELYIEDVCPQNLSFQRFQRYAICVSVSKVGIRYLKYFIRDAIVEDTEASRTLSMLGYNASLLSSSMKDLLLRANVLGLVNCRCDNEDLPSTVRHLYLESCQGIKYVVDNKIKGNANIHETEQVFSHLVSLRLTRMGDLEQVFRDSAINCSLQNLRELFIDDCTQMHSISFPRDSNLCNLKSLVLTDCPMLKSPALFTPSIAQTLVSLQELRIDRCTKLKHIIAEHEEEGNFGNGNGNQGCFSMALQNLRTIDVFECDELESILPLFLAWDLARLESLQVSSCRKVKYVFGGGKESKSTEIEINMPALTELYLSDMAHVNGLFPQQHCPTTMEKGMVGVVATTFDQLRNQVLPQPLQAFLNLQIISISDIQRWECIFELKVEGVDDDCEVIEEQAPLELTSHLSSLFLQRLPKLELIWKYPTQVLMNLQRLQCVSLYECPKLKTIFTPTIITSLPELRILTVEECHEWEGIISADSLPNLFSTSSHINACFPTLYEIRIRKCNKLKCLFPYPLASHCPSLQIVVIEDCFELERFGDGFENHIFRLHIIDCPKYISSKRIILLE